MKISSGILLFRENSKEREYLLIRPGGPFYKNLNEGIWTIPKGIVNENETRINAAKREFFEETGQEIHEELNLLGEVRLRKSKRLIIYAAKGNIDETKIKSNTFTMEYPKKSGEFREFPEIECGGWFTYSEAIKLIHPKLIVFLDKVERT